MFFAIGLGEIENSSKPAYLTTSWISHTFDLNPNSVPLDAWEFYFTTMYFSLLTMATIGYGDVVPVTI